MKAVRSAEKDRLSSCEFSDEIARLSIAKFDECCPKSLRESYKQTVLAAILIHSVKCGLRVVSLGVGTKVLGIERIAADEGRAGAPTLVRDCHAEVLARRAFVRYLYDILYGLGQRQSGVFPGPHHEADIPFQLDNGGLLVLKPGYTIHLYTSSQPCGNASIKLWAKGKKPKTYKASDLPKDSPFPLGVHSRLNVTAREQGQVALLVKRNGGLGTMPDPRVSSSSHLLPESNPSPAGAITAAGATNATSVVATATAAASTTATIANTTAAATTTTATPTAAATDGRVPPPAGTAYPAQHTTTTNTNIVVHAEDEPALASIPGCVMTCSDKIAKWNALGLQGALLSQFFEPIYLSTITVGRKYSETHCERALCCRLQDFRYHHDLTNFDGDGDVCRVVGGKGKCSNKKEKKEKSAAELSSSSPPPTSVASAEVATVPALTAAAATVATTSSTSAATVATTSSTSVVSGGAAIDEGETNGARDSDNRTTEEAASALSENNNSSCPSTGTDHQQQERRSQRQQQQQQQSPQQMGAAALRETTTRGREEFSIHHPATTRGREFGIHHPAMLCSSVKFDNSAIITAAVAGAAADTKRDAGDADELGGDDENLVVGRGGVAGTSRPRPLSSSPTLVAPIEGLGLTSSVRRSANAPATTADTTIATTTTTPTTTTNTVAVGAQFSERRCLAWWWTPALLSSSSSSTSSPSSPSSSSPDSRSTEAATSASSVDETEHKEHHGNINTNSTATTTTTGRGTVVVMDGSSGLDVNDCDEEEEEEEEGEALVRSLSSSSRSSLSLSSVSPLSSSSFMDLFKAHLLTAFNLPPIHNIPPPPIATVPATTGSTASYNLSSSPTASYILISCTYKLTRKHTFLFAPMQFFSAGNSNSLEQLAALLTTTTNNNNHDFLLEQQHQQQHQVLNHTVKNDTDDSDIKDGGGDDDNHYNNNNQDDRLVRQAQRWSSSISGGTSCSSSHEDGTAAAADDRILLYENGVLQLRITDHHITTAVLRGVIDALKYVHCKDCVRILPLPLPRPSSLWQEDDTTTAIAAAIAAAATTVTSRPPPPLCYNMLEISQHVLASSSSPLACLDHRPRWSRNSDHHSVGEVLATNTAATATNPDITNSHHDQTSPGAAGATNPMEACVSVPLVSVVVPVVPPVVSAVVSVVPVSTAAIAEETQAEAKKGGRQSSPHSRYSEVGEDCTISAYGAARELLLSDPRFFKGWVQKTGTMTYNSSIGAAVLE